MQETRLDFILYKNIYKYNMLTFQDIDQTIPRSLYKSYAAVQIVRVISSHDFPPKQQKNRVCCM